MVPTTGAMLAPQVQGRARQDMHGAVPMPSTLGHQNQCRVVPGIDSHAGGIWVQLTHGCEVPAMAPGVPSPWWHRQHPNPLLQAPARLHTV